MNIQQIYRLIQPHFRSQRTRLFLDLLRPGEATRILDVGGNIFDWTHIPITSPITILNVACYDAANECPARFKFVLGSGCELPFADVSFDIVYSNSVIEHVGPWEAQQRFAREALRVGRRVFIQTPNRWFHVEPHYLTLFLHYLPKGIRRPLMGPLSLRGWLRRGDTVDLKPMFEDLRLISRREMRTLFPGCDIRCERLCGLVKSFIATKV
jgi:SAM-dependent methyltransferase